MFGNKISFPFKKKEGKKFYDLAKLLVVAKIHDIYGMNFAYINFILMRCCRVNYYSPASWFYSLVYISISQRYKICLLIMIFNLCSYMKMIDNKSSDRKMITIPLKIEMYEKIIKVCEDNEITISQYFRTLAELHLKIDCFAYYRHVIALIDNEKLFKKK